MHGHIWQRNVDSHDQHLVMCLCLKPSAILSRINCKYRRIPKETRPHTRRHSIYTARFLGKCSSTAKRKSSKHVSFICLCYICGSVQGIRRFLVYAPYPGRTISHERDEISVTFFCLAMQMYILILCRFSSDRIYLPC